MKELLHEVVIVFVLVVKHLLLAEKKILQKLFRNNWE